MKKSLIIMMMLLFISPKADACVGKVLHIGVMNSSEGQLLAEVLSSLIVERTGSTVAIRFYNDEQELYEAVKVKQVDISIENTVRAMQVLNRPAVSDVNRA
jgi:osmoprotectant transport system substrate-binding protein